MYLLLLFRFHHFCQKGYFLCGLALLGPSYMLLRMYSLMRHITAAYCGYSAENSYDDISGKVVADFGCGCGTLSLAATLLDAEHVIGIDVDDESLEIASVNADELEVELELIQSEIKNLPWRGQIVDTVVMNPPFGTRKKGADMEFLSVALKVASQAVYSLHKTTTREVSPHFCLFKIRTFDWALS
ncbi:putative DNA methylase, N-6 adenine-specific, S-adenosyl-L-methionine-dependent methyltransferase [Helianthus annuus]|nr:putative DNA methylase, N-6 adenine-specific, S-adenosyl-L-methionine-dependent methyltransferase [Helianthus annuus]